jgi:hypothetical protein
MHTEALWCTCRCAPARRSVWSFSRPSRVRIRLLAVSSLIESAPHQGRGGGLPDTQRPPYPTALPRRLQLLLPLASHLGNGDFPAWLDEACHYAYQGLIPNKYQAMGQDRLAPGSFITSLPQLPRAAGCEHIAHTPKTPQASRRQSQIADRSAFPSMAECPTPGGHVYRPPCPQTGHTCPHP